jgi:hypothetical protein
MGDDRVQILVDSVQHLVPPFDGDNGLLASASAKAHPLAAFAVELAWAGIGEHHLSA